MVKRIGELLREHGWVKDSELERALADQRHAGKRICSLLIARGQLDPDDAARALGAQLGVAAVLQRHLEHRDPSLLKLLPAGFARSHVAMPLGRMGGGGLIICARAPTPSLAASLAALLPDERVVLAVAPSHQLEDLVARAYVLEEVDEFEVDLSTGPIPTIPLATEPSDPIADLATMTLVDLDDARVDKDPTQTLSFLAAGSVLPGTPRVSSATTGQVHAPRRLAAAPRLADTLAALAGTTSRDHATDLAMTFARGRWIAAVLLAINDGVALGDRGHGAQLSDEVVAAIAIPLTAPSLVQAAHDTRSVVTEPPAGSRTIQDRLERMLGQPRFPAAAPVLVGAQLTCVLAVGDPIAGDSAEAPAELARLCVALGEAYARIVREPKRS